MDQAEQVKILQILLELAKRGRFCMTSAELDVFVKAKRTGSLNLMEIPSAKNALVRLSKQAGQNITEKKIKNFQEYSEELNTRPKFGELLDEMLKIAQFDDDAVESV